jgi:hypothetical protein
MVDLCNVVFRRSIILVRLRFWLQNQVRLRTLNMLNFMFYLLNIFFYIFNWCQFREKPNNRFESPQLPEGLSIHSIQII